MTWSPIGKDELDTLIADAVAMMDTPSRSLWSFLNVPPTKWALSPWGDLGGGFWVVGVFGRRVVWFNDIEWGFNISRYDDYGVIDQYRCDQIELQDTMYLLRQNLEGGESFGHFGPPEPLHADD